MRRRVAVWAAVAISVVSLFVGLVAVPAASAASSTSATSTGGGLSNLVSPSNQNTGSSESTTPTEETTTSTSSGTGLGKGDAIAIAIVTVLVLGGIAAYVFLDARRQTAGISDSVLREAEGGRKGSKAPQKTRKLSPAERKRRKRGKSR